MGAGSRKLAREILGMVGDRIVEKGRNPVTIALLFPQAIASTIL
jgi:hypothetical protein